MNKNTYKTFSPVATVLALTALLIIATSPSAWAQDEEKNQSPQVDSSETNTQPWPQSTKHDFTIEPELFIGQRGYIHGGFEFEKPINEKFELGLSAHVVRENSEGSFFPSVGVSLTTEISEGLEFTAFTFGVRRQSIWHRLSYFLRDPFCRYFLQSSLLTAGFVLSFASTSWL